MLALLAFTPSMEARRNLRGSAPEQKWMFRGLIDFKKALKAGVADVIHQGTEVATSLGFEEEGGAPAKQVNTTAGGKYLVEELLSNKKLTKEVRLTPTQMGWVQHGRIFNIYMKDAQVGDATRVYIGRDGNVHFDIEDLDVGVECQYDLRLTSLNFGETGRVKGRLKGSGMTLRFPEKGVGRGSCDFQKGLDLEVLDAISDRDAMNVAIDDILQQNLVGVRSEIVEEMEDGLCRALLAPDIFVNDPKAAVPLPAPRSMWPLVVGAVLVLFVLLVATFFLGRCSAQEDYCSQSKVLRDEEEGSSESEGDVNELVNFKHSRYH